MMFGLPKPEQPPILARTLLKSERRERGRIRDKFRRLTDRRSAAGKGRHRGGPERRCSTPDSTAVVRSPALDGQLQRLVGRRALERDPVPIQGATGVRGDAGVFEYPAVGQDDADRAEVRRLGGEQGAPKSDPTCLVECEAKQLATNAAPSLGRPNLVTNVSAVEEEHGDQLVAQPTAGDDALALEEPEPGHAN